MISLADVFDDFEGLAAKGFAGLTCLKPTVMIAMTSRTGSTHLCAALAAAGDVGKPTEIFNPRGVAQHEKKIRKVDDFAAYIKSFQDEPSATFIFKTNFRDFARLAPHVGAIFPKSQIVYLDRHDVVAQAVSSFRARISGEWHRSVNKMAPPSDGLRPQFDLSAIREQMTELETDKARWERFFATSGYVPVRLFYEDFAADVRDALRILGPALGLPLRSVPAETGLQRLADALSEEWIERVRRDLQPPSPRLT
jgi:LPS sulfotransferase NodH